jgi:transposase
MTQDVLTRADVLARFGVRTFEELVHQQGGPPVHVGKAAPVGHQPALFRKVLVGRNGWQPVRRGQRRQPCRLARCRGVRHHEERLGTVSAHRRHGTLEFLRSPIGHELQLHTQGLRRLLQLGHALHVGGKLRVPEDADAGGARHRFLEQLQPFRVYLGRDVGHFREIPPGPGQAGDEPTEDRVGDRGKDDGNRAGRVLGRQGGWRPPGDEHVDREPTSSAASAGSRSYCPSATRDSRAIFSPSTYPSSASPCRNTSENNVVVGALTAMSTPTRGTFPAGCASEASGATKRARVRVMPSAIRRRSMGTSDVHELSGAFYALHVSEGTQILQDKLGSWPDLVRPFPPHLWGILYGWLCRNLDSFQSMEVRDTFAHVLPKLAPLQVDAWYLDDVRAQITLLIASTQAAPRCPTCDVPAPYVHSHYTRTLADLPWSGYAILWRLRVRKLFCRNRTCPRRIFTERLPGVVAPWARRTVRLMAHLLAIALALGGAAGARLSRSLGLIVSRNTLLRVIRRTPSPAVVSPQVLSVDDFALRKGHTYGTILLDLERRRPLALLPDREAATVARWLQAHPGVDVLVRDRAEADAEAARLGAPAACQVADRFHLLQNLADVLIQVFTAHTSQLARVTPSHVAAPTPVHDPTCPAVAPEPASVPLAPPQSSTAAARLARQRRTRRWANYHRVWTYHRQGWTLDAIAQQVGLSRRTVRRDLQSPTFPERPPRHGRDRSILDPYKAVLLAGWNRGCRNGWHLFRTIRSQGFRGQYGIVALYVRRLRQAQGLAPRQRRSDQPLPTVTEAPRRRLTPRRATGLVLRPAARLTAPDHDQLAQPTQQAPELAEAVTLAQEFAGLVRQRQPARLEPWLARAATSALPPFRRFARGLRADMAAVQAAVTLPWSQGPIEGHINRLKVLKRQMFGRARLDLLARRFLLAA